ncbi:ammonium transporter [Lacticaseibacillus paracasei]|uniref:ammonium transporter n=1 Tax=Lacticaseibacillus paracasei TaxID=1597 RepID=UPI003396BF0B
MFVLICFLIMLPMIFSVPLLYVGMLARSRQQLALLTMSVTLMTAIGCWLVFGNRFAFGANLLKAVNFSSLLAGFVQMDFYLYAVAMLIGTVAGIKGSRYLLGFIPVWTLLVYCPLARWLWADHGWLQQLGALDFSGGLVVHLTAGLTSLVLAKSLAPDPEAIAQNDDRTDYAATIMILVGWLGFNLAPVGSLNAHAMQVLVNTFVAVLLAIVSWCWVAYRQNGVVKLGDLLNGILCGLVSSTALVGYVTALTMAIVGVAAGWLCQTAVFKMQESKKFYDAVDSFAINAVGGVIGVAGLIVARFFNQSDHLENAWRFAIIELLAVVVTIVLTLIGTVLAQIAARLSETAFNCLQKDDVANLNLRKER